MLKTLSVKNYALIDHLEINFSSGLNIITGETGAGKSILLGALSLILGQRADLNVLFDKNTKCVIEGTFDISSYNLQTIFDTHALDYEDETIIRREITPSGKSRAFINDTPVNLTILKELSAVLVNLHAQHETLALNTEAFQLSVVDAFANHQEVISNYRITYNEYKSIEKELTALTETNTKAQQEHDYNKFLLDEFEGIELDAALIEKLEEDLKTLSNAENIKADLNQIQESLSENELSAFNLLNEVSGKLQGLLKYHNTAISQVYERFESSFIELKDIADEVAAINDKIEYDPERISEATEQLNAVYKLQKKHNAFDINELITIRENLETKVDALQNAEQNIGDLEQKLALSKAKLSSLGETLFANRAKAKPVIEQKVSGMLAQLGMQNAAFTIQHQKTDDLFKPTGIDTIQFYFSANRGIPPSELKKVASGGELSRLMLTLKTLLADSISMPTLIFDEIDTGISGEVAFKVGHLLEEMGNHHQLICITHLPQIAGKGNAHFFVHKEIDAEKTYTRIKLLNQDERILEIAKMLAGDAVSDAALANARELLN